MFKSSENLDFNYAPIISVKLSEMEALCELAEKSKDLLLPLIPLRPWQSSKKLENTFKRIKDTFGDRKVIIDIDQFFLSNYYEKRADEEGRPVINEIHELADSTNGYENWIRLITAHENYIPTVQLGDLSVLEDQLAKLIELNRGIVVRFNAAEIDIAEHLDTLNRIAEFGCDDLFLIYDYGQVSREILSYVEGIANLIQLAHSRLNNPLISVSSTSFPSSFSGYSDGDISIIERLLFNKLRSELEQARFVYSDWASARADRIEGGGRVPPPRLDYPLKNEWMILREDFEDPKDIKKGEKEGIYKKLALKMTTKEYWDKSLHVWGTQLIELTSLGDAYGISSPQKSTAVRINIHLHQQLYYDHLYGSTDTDDLWLED